MQSESRREIIINILRESKGPKTGSQLAKKLGVSRQIIVQDIALLRATGINIFATPQGYLMPKEEDSKMIKVIACCHDQSGTKRELETIVDNGGKVIDVTVEHPLYGEIKGMLMLGSRLDIENFMKHYEKKGTKPLSILTGGVHLHTIEVYSEESYKQIIHELDQNGYLIKSR